MSRKLKPILVSDVIYAGLHSYRVTLESSPRNPTNAIRDILRTTLIEDLGKAPETLDNPLESYNFNDILVHPAIREGLRARGVEITDLGPWSLESL